MASEKKFVHSDPALLNKLKEGDSNFNLGFVQLMLKENLNHLRHAEMERLLYCIVVAIASLGAFVLLAAVENLLVKAGIALLLLVFILLTKELSERWGLVFDRHMENAKRCYLILHEEIFKDKISLTGKPEDKEEFILEDKTGLGHYPLYAFGIKKSKWLGMRTNTAFTYYFIFLAVLAAILLVYNLIVYFIF